MHFDDLPSHELHPKGPQWPLCHDQGNAKGGIGLGTRGQKCPLKIIKRCDQGVVCGRY